MGKGLSALVFPTSDATKAKEVFSRVLGGPPAFDSPNYVGWQIAGLNVGLDPNGEERGMTGAAPFFEVDDIAETIAALRAAGADLVEDAHPVGGGMRVAILSDADGNMIGLSQSG